MEKAEQRIQNENICNGSMLLNHNMQRDINELATMFLQRIIIYGHKVN